MIQQMANQSRRPNVANVTGIQLENIRQYIGNKDTQMSRIRPPEGNMNVIVRALDIGIEAMSHMDMSAVGIVAGCTSKRREGMIQGGQWNAWQKGCVRVRRHSHQVLFALRIKVGIPGKSDPSGNEGRIMRIVPVMKAATYPGRHNAGQYLDQSGMPGQRQPRKSFQDIIIMRKRRMAFLNEKGIQPASPIPVGKIPGRNKIKQVPEMK
ncbi:hypothetical protein [Akkermansia muciniphila]|nr:hypothetical protein [Akkermansia muciniphila]